MSEPEYRTQHVAQAPAGWHVRTIPSGEHWIRLAFPPGPRRRGSGELVEILHPAGENPKQCNPAELVILANPRVRGDRFTEAEKKELRRLGLKPSHYTTDEEVDSVREMFREIDRINEKYRGKNPPQSELYDAIRAGDRVTIVNRFGQQRTGRAVMRGPAGWVLNMGGPHGTPAIAHPDNVTKVSARRNPEGETSETDQAVRLYQEFHGKDPKGIIEAQRSAAMRLDYVCLGPLLGLAPYVDGLKIPSPAHWDDGGYPVLEFEGVKLAANAAGTQLYAIEGDQDLSELLEKFPDVDSSKDLVDLGPIAYVTYEARKSLDNFELVQYTHEFDEPRPLLGFDQVKREIFFVGGRYQVNAPGIEH